MFVPTRMIETSINRDRPGVIASVARPSLSGVIASVARQSIDCMDRHGLRPRDDESVPRDDESVPRASWRERP